MAIHVTVEGPNFGFTTLMHQAPRVGEFFWPQPREKWPPCKVLEVAHWVGADDYAHIDHHHIWCRVKKVDPKDKRKGK